jgi:predicted extracellular nuclease
MRLRHAALFYNLAAVTVAATAISVLGPASGAAAATATDLFISEYVEGSGNNKALEFFNGTGSPIDLTAGQYVVQVYFNGGTTPTTIPLTGTVAAGDVFVFAAGAAATAILAQADQTYGGALFNGDDAIVLRRGGATGAVLDSIGQVGVDPGTEWGTGLASSADNTLRRAGRVTSGDTTTDDAFDPAAQWQGYPQDTVDDLGAHRVDAGPVDQPAVLNCGGTLSTSQGAAVTRTVTATDPDDTVTDLAVTAVTPTPAAGTISRTSFTPATAPGGTASAVVSASADLPVGSYEVTVTSIDTGGTTGTCSFTVQVSNVLTVGEVQGPTSDGENGRTDRSPLAPPTGNGTSSGLSDVQGVITQKTLARTAAGASQYGFFLQSRLGADDGDPTSSDGIFVFMGSFTTIIGGYSPKVGDEVVLRVRVSEYFNQTQLSSASLVRVVATGLDVNTAVAVTDARPPADSVAADRYWERHEGERLRVRAGDVVTGARDVFASTDDSEIWLLDREDPLVARTDPYARRAFRDAHPLDDIPGTRFDNGNGQRILIGSQGVKAVAGDNTASDKTAGDNTALLPPARDFDTLSGDAVGGVTYGFSKYSVQPEQVAFTPGADPAANHPVRAADRGEQVAVATFNMENLYDFRNDPFDGCDFTGDAGCPGVSPPFDYVPASEAAYTTRLNGIASQVVNDMKAPDLILTQEAEDQDICTVTAGALTCGTTDNGPTDNADGKPDVLQELALAITATGGPAYDTAYDRNGADARGITSAFLYRTDRLSLPAPAATDPILGASPAVQYRTAGAPYNADVQNPKALNAELPRDIDRSTGVDGTNVYTRAPQVAHFFVKAAPGASEGYDLWAVSNHFSSTPDARVGQRTEQAGYGAAIAQAVAAAAPNARFVYGGDLNVFPRPDDPIARTDADTPSDQLGPLYKAGLHNLWDDLAAANPAAAYSYVFQGQAQTLDSLFVNDNLHRDLIEMRAAHVNADFPADFDGDGARGVSDHDPQVARFRSRPYISVADASVAEGASGTRPLAFTVTLSRPLSEAGLLCASTLDLTATGGQDYDPVFGCKQVKAGTTSATFTVTVKGDRHREPDERFLLVVGGDPRIRYARAVATGTIVNDD